MDERSGTAIERQQLWPVRAAAVLFLLQGAGLLIVPIRAGLRLAEMDQLLPRSLSDPLVDVFSNHGVFLPLGILSLVAALGLGLRRAWAWLLAMTAQGFLLLSTLVLHFTNDSISATAFMASGVILVFYIRSFGVRATLTRDRNETP